MEEIKLNTNDSMFRLIDRTTRHVTYITSHHPESICKWHTDYTMRSGSFSGNLLNYILYINNGDFTGGNIKISEEHIQDTPGEDVGITPLREPKTEHIIEPINNRLVLFPTPYWHMVESVENKSYKNPIDGRLTVHGHIGI